MYKLVILIEPQMDILRFEDSWPKFLEYAEKMPGLIRETTSRVDRILAGNCSVEKIHELYFESMEAALEAMASPNGQAAGKVLQAMTGGNMTLMLAHHLEDEIENIKRYREEPSDDATAAA
ncbi:MAG: EthD family reductase [Anaerolineales bacterium]|nr:EthD family reductase [Anaerolineales bacterium]